MTFWASFSAFMVKLFAWLPTLLAYLAGRRAVHSETALETAKKNTEYLEIELKERDDIKRMKDGTW